MNRTLALAILIFCALILASCAGVAFRNGRYLDIVYFALCLAYNLRVTWKMLHRT